MKISELFPHTFKALRHKLGHDRPRDTRPLWQRRRLGQPIYLSPLLEQRASAEQKQRKIDIVDYWFGGSKRGGCAAQTG